MPMNSNYASANAIYYYTPKHSVVFEPPTPALYSHEIKKQEMKYIIYSGVGIVLMFVSNIGLECTQSSPVLGQGELTATHAKDSNDMYTGRMICHECSCIRSNKK